MPSGTVCYTATQHLHANKKNPKNGVKLSPSESFVLAQHIILPPGSQ